MAQGDIGTSAGDIRGKPIIWPSGKSSGQPVSSAPTTETAGGVRTSAPTSSAPTAPAAPTTAPTGTPATAAPARMAPSIARPLTIEDIKAHLIKINIPDTDFNVKLASLMIKDGMELSRANFVKLLSMLEGTSKGFNVQEAAIMLAMKGIDDPKALQILSQFFAENPQLASQMAALQEGLAGLNSAFSSSSTLLNSNLVAQLTALLSQFDETLRGLNEKYQFSGDSSINSSDLMDAMRGLKALLSGVQEKAVVSDSAEAQVLQANLSSTLSKMNSAIDNLVAQGLLSQKGREEVNFLYQQMPNTSAKPPQNVEIVVKREGQGKESNIDNENTQIVMSMDTTNLGKMVCSMIVKGKKVYVIFVFNEKEYGDDARNLIAAEFANLQKKLADKDFVVTGYQVKIDPAMCAIRPYLISMLPTLEAQLRKIDLEA